MKQIAISEIAQRAARLYRVPVEVMRSPSRKRKHVDARCAAIYAARIATDATLQELGFIFNRTHASIIHAIKHVEKNRKLIDVANLIMEKTCIPTA